MYILNTLPPLGKVIHLGPILQNRVALMMGNHEWQVLITVHHY